MFFTLRKSNLSNDKISALLIDRNANFLNIDDCAKGGLYVDDVNSYLCNFSAG